MKRKNKKKPTLSIGIAKNTVMAQEFDKVLFGITILLSIFGIIIIYSATRTLESNTNVNVLSVA